MQWNGNWAAINTIEALGDDVLFLPAPDFGNGSTIGAGSWQFGVSATSDHPGGALAFIEFMLKDEYITAFSDGVGNIPATSSAAADSEFFKRGRRSAVGVLRPERRAGTRPPGDTGATSSRRRSSRRRSPTSPTAPT